MKTSTDYNLEQHMDEEEVSVNEEDAPEVQHDDLRSLLDRLRPEGSARPRVVKWPNCSSVDEATFIRCLKCLFLLILTVAVTNLIMFELRLTHHRLPDKPLTLLLLLYFRISWMGTVLLAVFAAAVVVGVFVKKMSTKSSTSAAPKREQVQTISALIQQV